MVVYKITNIINSKVYIGCTTKTVEERFKKHCLKRNNTIFGKAIKSYGRDNFTIEIIETCLSEKDMFEKEIFWIKEFKSNNRDFGYNMTEGGDRGAVYYGEDNWSFGRKNEKLSELNKSRKGQKQTKEHIENVRKAMIGKKRSKETKLKMSIARKVAWEKGLYKDTKWH